MKVMLNPEAWSIDAWVSGDETVFAKGVAVEIDAKAFDAAKNETINHFGKEVPALIQVGAEEKADAAKEEKAKA